MTPIIVRRIFAAVIFMMGLSACSSGDQSLRSEDSAVLRQECAVFNQGAFDKPLSRKSASLGVGPAAYSLDDVRLGFNASYTIFKDDVGRFPVSELSRYADKLPLQALRFPGGTVGNFFDWSTMTLRPEWEGFAPKRSVVELVKRHRNINKGKDIPADIQSFLKAASSLSFSPYIVLNLYTQDLNTTLEAIDSIKESYAGVVHWELGNELSHSEYSHKLADVGWSIDDYIRRADRVRGHIRTHYPKDKIAVVGGDIVVDKTLFDFNRLKKFQKQSDEWNRAVSAMNDIDGVVFHPYTKTFGEDKWQRTDIYDDLGRGCLDYMNYVWMLSTADRFPTRYRELRGQYFPEKKLWLTELGIISSGATGKRNSGAQQDPFTNSRLRTFLLINQYLIWLKSGSDIDSILYHTLGYGRSQAVVEGLDRRLNVNGYALNILYRALKDASEIAALDFNGDVKRKGVARTSSYRFGQLNGVRLHYSSGAKPKLVLANTSLTTSFDLSGGEGWTIKELFKVSDEGLSPEKTGRARETDTQLITVPPMTVVIAEKG